MWCIFVLELLSLFLVCVCFSKKKKKLSMGCTWTCTVESWHKNCVHKIFSQLLNPCSPLRQDLPSFGWVICGELIGLLIWLITSMFAYFYICSIHKPQFQFRLYIYNMHMYMAYWFYYYFFPFNRLHRIRSIMVVNVTHPSLI